MKRYLFIVFRTLAVIAGAIGVFVWFAIASFPDLSDGSGAKSKTLDTVIILMNMSYNGALIGGCFSRSKRALALWFRYAQGIVLVQIFGVLIFGGNSRLLLLLIYSGIFVVPTLLWFALLGTSPAKLTKDENRGMSFSKKLADKGSESTGAITDGEI